MPTPRLNKGLGAKTDPYDSRDFILEERFRSLMGGPRHIGGIPRTVDLRDLCSPVRDQGQLGACTGFGLATGLREFLEMKAGTPSPEEELSPMFLYYQERKIEGTITQDSGANIRDGLRVLRGMGVCPESDYPYDPPEFSHAPSRQAVNDAKKFTIRSYFRLTTLTGLKMALAGQHGCVLGMQVYESFESDEVASTGKVPMPQAGEKLLGGHCVFCVGYQDDVGWDGGGYLIVKNSWGLDWGDKGYFYLPNGYVRPKLMSDMWTAIL
jgi:C1A family cysteine protease